MNSQAIKLHKSRVDGIIAKSSSINTDDSQALSEWAKYLCIIIAGFIEKSVGNLIIDLASAKTSRPFKSYMLHHASKIQNPKSSKICEIAATLKSEWSDEISQFMNDNGRKEAIDAVMTNRHLIAHGKSQNAQTITVARIKNYYTLSIEVIDKLEEILQR